MSAAVFHAARAVVNGGRDLHVAIVVVLAYLALGAMALAGWLE